ncbi:hypothetical protein Tco_0133283 [Tanacetum coccineum]
MFQQHHGIDLWLQVQIFYDHVNPVTRRTIDQSASGKLRDLNPKESWAILEDLALYDNESWNDLRDFAKPVKAITLPQDVPSTSDHRLIELENQVHRLMEAHLTPTQPTQVNKITTPCKICKGPHDTHVCIDDLEQACVDYASSRINEMGSERFTSNQRPMSFNDVANTWKEKPNFNWAHTQTFTSLQGGLSHLRTQIEQQHDDMIGKINLLWKTVSEKLNSVSTPENTGNPMAPKSIEAIGHDKREELRKKGIPVMKAPEHKINEKLIKGLVNNSIFNNSRSGTRVGKKKGKEYKILPGGPAYDAILKKMITRKGDIEGNFKIPCSIGNLKHVNALIDQGSDVNVMPYSTYIKLTNSLASHSNIYPLGIVEDVLVEVAEHVYPHRLCGF